MAVVELGRAQVLAHRAAVQDLVKPVRRAVDSAVLRVGLQNTPAGSGAIGLVGRCLQKPSAVASAVAADGALAVVYAARGAPYVVRRSELASVVAAFYPLDAEEAAGVDEVAGAMREVVRDGMSRPELSEAITSLVSDAVRGWCERCQAEHVNETIFRKATLRAGLEIDAEASPMTFRIAEGGRGAAGVAGRADRARSAGNVEAARVELFRAYVQLTGVTTPAEAAAWLGYQVGDVKESWRLLEDELTPCRVEGRRRWALTEDLESLRNAQPPQAVALLPPSDVYLLGDRSLVVPDRQWQRELWRPLQSPGAIFVDGEIVGTWRQRLHRDRLEITATTFQPLDPTVRSRLDHAAERIANLRAANDVTTTWTD